MLPTDSVTGTSAISATTTAKMTKEIQPKRAERRTRGPEPEPAGAPAGSGVAAACALMRAPSFGTGRAA